MNRKGLPRRLIILQASILLIVFAAMLGLPGAQANAPGAGSAATRSWVIQTVDSAGNVGWYTSLAVDNAGYPHISYYDFTNDNLKYARWTGSAWSIQTVDNSGDVSGETSLAVDSAGNPHISYHVLGDLKYARWTGSAWDLQTVDIMTLGSLIFRAIGQKQVRAWCRRPAGNLARPGSAFVAQKVG